MTHHETAGKITMEVIGPVCSFCRDLYQRVREVVAKRRMNADIVHVTDPKTARDTSPSRRCSKKGILFEYPLTTPCESFSLGGLLAY
jgi:hypothetical protein